MTDVEEITGSPMGPGTLYAALARLERRGLIEAAGGRSTAAGRIGSPVWASDGPRPARATAGAVPDGSGAPSGDVMSALLRLYPRSWRERYEREVLGLLEARPPSLGDRVDIVRGAVDARLNLGAPHETDRPVGSPQLAAIAGGSRVGDLASRGDPWLRRARNRPAPDRRDVSWAWPPASRWPPATSRSASPAWVGCGCGAPLRHRSPRSGS